MRGDMTIMAIVFGALTSGHADVLHAPKVDAVLIATPHSLHSYTYAACAILANACSTSAIRSSVSSSPI
jgi:predicted dehydrogenase